MRNYSYTFGGIVIATILGFVIGASIVFIILDKQSATPIEFSNSDDQRIGDLEAQLASANEQILKTKDQLIASQKQNAELLEQRQELQKNNQPEFGVLPSTSYESDFINLVEPASLASACFGDSLFLTWSASGDVQFVDVYLTPSAGNDVFLGTYSHSGNKITHNILLNTDIYGTSIPMNIPYSIKLEGHFSVEDRASGRPSTLDTSNFSFPIIECLQ